MTSIPVAWVISIFALLLTAIVSRLVRMPLFARFCFCIGFISIAVVATFVGVRFQFNDPAFIVLQPYVAAITAPAFWLGFHTLTTQDGFPTNGALRAMIATLIAAWILIALPYPWTATVAVILINIFYALRLLSFLRLPAERFIHIAAKSYPTLRITLIGCVAFLMLVVTIDVSVLGTGFTAGEARAMALLSYAAVIVAMTVLLGVVAALSFGMRALQPTGDELREKVPPLEEDRAVLFRLNALMEDAALFRDPELTVARLGRRLGVPARAVSTAVNRVTGESTTRYINGLRVQHAVRLLEGSNLPVTDIMLESGFISKSSFNTEFRRITGTTPSDHRKAHRSDAKEVRKQVSVRSKS